MRRLVDHWPSPAMVVAFVALAVTLGGTGYAAVKLPRSSVGTAQLKADAVTGAKVKDGSLGPQDFAAGLRRGPRGPVGPKGEAGTPASATVASASGYTSRETGSAPVSLAPAGSNVDVLDLAVPGGSSGYGASSGNVVTIGPGRLVATATATVHSSSTPGSLFCRLILSTSGGPVRPIGVANNANLVAISHVNVTVTAGADVDAGSHNVRAQCAGAAGFEFHRGNLTVVVTPR